MKSIDKNALPASAPASTQARASGAPLNKTTKVKKAFVAFAGLLVAGIACAATTPTAPAAPLSYDQLSYALHIAAHDAYELSGFVGAAVHLNLWPLSGVSSFVSAADIHGMTFVCQAGFADFAGGPVNATITKYEAGDDRRDVVTLDGCTPLER